MTLQKIFILVFFEMASSNLIGQSIKDYYIPSQSNYNKASFYTPDKNGNKTNLTRLIYYDKNADGTYDILDARMFKGNPTAISTQTVKITTTEVKMIKSISTTVFEKNKKQTFEPARILIKMPLAGQTISWSVKDEEEPTKYTASWTTVTIDGQDKKAIKVTCQHSDWKSKTVSYYVQGIGLMNTEFIDENGTTKPFENFEVLSYEAIKK